MFGGSPKVKVTEPDLKVLHAKIGQLALENDFLESALAKAGLPAIFNTDQSCQFTSLEFTDMLKQNNIAISMGGWRDNVFVERLWRSVKYEKVYLHA